MDKMDQRYNSAKIKQKINVDELKDTPFYMRSDAYPASKGLIGVKMDGVKNADKIRINKSDYTQRGE